MLDSGGIIQCCSIASGIFLNETSAKVESLLPRAAERERAKEKALSTGLLCIARCCRPRCRRWAHVDKIKQCKRMVDLGNCPFSGALFGLVTQ